MYSLIVDTVSPVTLLGGGDAMPAMVNEALSYAPHLVAADGGAGVALKMGRMPEAVIGDFDSIDAETVAKIPEDRLHRIDEQDSTDFEKCLRHIAAPLILGVGFMGQRLDHELVAYNALVRHPDQRCILLGEVDICFLARSEMQFDLPRGTRFSLFPMAPCRVDATGLRWPLAGHDLAPDAAISTSNQVVGGQVELRVSAPKLLVILPRTRLAAAITALRPPGVRA